jgi:hypothetical protein
MDLSTSTVHPSPPPYRVTPTSIDSIMLARAPSPLATPPSAPTNHLEQRVDALERAFQNFASQFDELNKTMASIKKIIENEQDRIRQLDARQSTQEVQMTALQSRIEANNCSINLDQVERRLDTVEQRIDHSSQFSDSPSTSAYDLGATVPRTAQNVLNVSQAVAKLTQLDTPEALNIKKARDRQPFQVTLTGDAEELFKFICCYNTYREACRVAMVIPLPIGSCLAEATCTKVGITLPIPYPTSPEHATSLTQAHCTLIFNAMYAQKPFLSALASFLVPEPRTVHNGIAFRAQRKLFFDRSTAISRFPVRIAASDTISHPYAIDVSRLLDIFMLGLPHGHIPVSYTHLRAHETG